MSPMMLVYSWGHIVQQPIQWVLSSGVSALLNSKEHMVIPFSSLHLIPFHSTPLVYLCQDVAEYIGEITFASAGTGTDITSAVSDMYKRQRAWLGKRKVKGVNACWRPKKRYRKSSFQWCAHLHHMLEMYVPGGLQYCKVPNKRLSNQAHSHGSACV